jgi:WD40 repeat protein
VAFYGGFGPQVLTLTGSPKVKKMDYDPQDGTGIAMDNKGTVFVTTTRTVISAIDSQTGQLIKNIAELRHDTWAAVVSPDGKYLAAGIANTVRLYDPKTREELGRFAIETPETLAFNSLAFSADGTKIAAGGGVPYVTSIGKDAKNFSIFVWNTADMAKP